MTLMLWRGGHAVARSCLFAFYILRIIHFIFLDLFFKWSPPVPAAIGVSLFKRFVSSPFFARKTD